MLLTIGKINLTEWSSNWLLAVSFCGTKSQGYGPAVEIAKGTYYQEGETASGLTHCAAFPRSIDGATRALTLLDCLGNIRTLHIFTGSHQIWGSGRVRGVLQCYIQGMSCDNHLAHCCKEYLGEVIPCKKLEIYYSPSTRRPGSIESQMQAAAVEAGVEWCPLFDWKNWSGPVIRRRWVGPIGIE